MSVIHVFLLTLLCLYAPCVVFATDITLYKFSEDANPEPSKFNENFDSLRAAILQSAKEIEQVKSDVKKQNVTANTVNERLQAIEKVVEQLRIVVEERGKSTAAPLLEPSATTDSGGVFLGKEYVSDIVKVQVVSIKSGPTVTLRLKFINMTEKPIELIAREHNSNTYLIDENNNQYPYEKSELSDRGSRMELTPQGQKIVVFEFGKQQRQDVGKRFEFYSKIGYKTVVGGGQFQDLFVKINNIGL